MSSSRFTDAALAAVARREVKLARPSPNAGWEAGAALQVLLT
jgi:hypothetical protein